VTIQVKVFSSLTRQLEEQQIEYSSLIADKSEIRNDPTSKAKDRADGAVLPVLQADA
jgi:hypothetical protein